MAKKAKKKVAKKNGRPTKYKAVYARQASKLCQLGAIDKDLASFFNVSVSTISTWKLEQPKFLESIKKSKEIADNKVIRSLFERATGYEHPEDKIFCTDGDVTTVKTMKHYPPDATSMIFWLKNRLPELFRDKQVIEHGLDQDTITLLGLIDGSSKGQLPTKQEEKDAG